MKRHVLKQPTSLDRGPEIGLMDFYGDPIVKNTIKYFFQGFPRRHNCYKNLDAFSVMPQNAQKFFLQAAMVKTERSRPKCDFAKHDGTVTTLLARI